MSFIELVCSIRWIGVREFIILIQLVKLSDRGCENVLMIYLTEITSFLKWLSSLIALERSL